MVKSELLPALNVKAAELQASDKVALHFNAIGDNAGLLARDLR